MPTRCSPVTSAACRPVRSPDAGFDGWERHWAELGFGLLALEWRETGALVGRSGVAYHRAWPDDPEVGCAIDPA
jgi:hypothetical protein